MVMSLPYIINLHVRALIFGSYVGQVCRLMMSGTSPAQYGPHRLIIPNQEESLQTANALRNPWQTKLKITHHKMTLSKN